MGSYIVVNSHTPEECEPMEVVISHLPEPLRGKDFICTCPEGPHGFYMLVEARTAEEAIQGLPPQWRKGTAAYPAEIFHL
jgi:hypothetical protein